MSNQKKERNRYMKEWPSEEKQFSEHAALLGLMWTLPEVVTPPMRIGRGNALIILPA